MARSERDGITLAHPVCGTRGTVGVAPSIRHRVVRRFGVPSSKLIWRAMEIVAEKAPRRESERQRAIASAG